MLETSCVARFVDLPPLVAAAAYEAQRMGPSGLVLSVGAVRLRSTGPCTCSDGADARPYRTEPAVLHLGMRRVRVEVELRPWSRHRVELALRPTSRRAVAPAVVAAGHVLVEELAARLQAWADEPLRQLPAPAA